MIFGYLLIDYKYIYVILVATGEIVIDAKTKSYLSYVKDVVEYVEKELSRLDKETRAVVINHSIIPIGFWNANEQKTFSNDHTQPKKWFEKYSQLKPINPDCSVITIDEYIERAMFDEINTEAKKNGYRYIKEERAFVRVV